MTTEIHNTHTCPCEMCVWARQTAANKPKSPSETYYGHLRLDRGDTGFLVPEAKNVPQGDSSAGSTQLISRSDLRAALFEVMDSGWQCGHACDIKHPWSFDPYDESDAETVHRVRFVDTVIARLGKQWRS